jgi:hypothetical protein
MSSPRALRHVVIASLVLTTGILACEKDEGGFGAPVNPEPGNNVKKVEDPSILPDFAAAMTVVPSYDAATKKLVVTLDIRPGFHAYGPGEEIGKPVELSVDAASGFTVNGTVEIPAGKEKNLGDLGKSIILEGQVPLTATLAGGEGSAAVLGTVNVQICTDKACDRPRPHAFKIALN